MSPFFIFEEFRPTAVKRRPVSFISVGLVLSYSIFCVRILSWNLRILSGGDLKQKSFGFTFVKILLDTLPRWSSAFGLWPNRSYFIKVYREWTSPSNFYSSRSATGTGVECLGCRVFERIFYSSSHSSRDTLLKQLKYSEVPYSCLIIFWNGLNTLSTRSKGSIDLLRIDGSSC